MDFFNSSVDQETGGPLNGEPGRLQKGKRMSQDVEADAPSAKKRGRPLGAKAKFAPIPIAHWEALLELVVESGLSLAPMTIFFENLDDEYQGGRNLKRAYPTGRLSKESVERCWVTWRDEVLAMSENFVAPVVFNKFWSAQYEYTTSHVKEEREKAVIWHTECGRLQRLWPTWYAECKKLQHLQIVGDEEKQKKPRQRPLNGDLLAEMRSSRQDVNNILDHLAHQEAQLKEMYQVSQSSFALLEKLSDDLHAVKAVLTLQNSLTTGKRHGK